MPIRPAIVDDVAAIATVQVASWEGAYRGLMPGSVFDYVTLEWRIQHWQRYFAGSLVGREALVAENAAGDVVGMASVGRNRDADVVETNVAELYAIYVDPAAWNQGHGRDLMLAALDGMRSRGNHLATLWVLDSNDRARRFYEGGGWATDGSSKVDLSFGEPMREVRYRLKL